MADKFQGLYNIAGQLANVGSAMDPNPNGFARNLGKTNAEMAEAEIIKREIKREEEEAKKKKKQALGRGIGSAIGSVIGTIIGGPAGGAIGGGLGGSAGTAATGGKPEFGEIAQDAITSGVTSFAAPKLLSGAGQLATKAGASGVGNAVTGLANAPASWGTSMAYKLAPYGMDGLGNAMGKFAGVGAQQMLMRPVMDRLLLGMAPGAGFKDEEEMARRGLSGVSIPMLIQGY